MTNRAISVVQEGGEGLENAEGGVRRRKRNTKEATHKFAPFLQHRQCVMASTVITRTTITTLEYLLVTTPRL